MPLCCECDQPDERRWNGQNNHLDVVNVECGEILGEGENRGSSARMNCGVTQTNHLIRTAVQREEELLTQKMHSDNLMLRKELLNKIVGIGCCWHWGIRCVGCSSHGYPRVGDSFKGELPVLITRGLSLVTRSTLLDCLTQRKSTEPPSNCCSAEDHESIRNNDTKVIWIR